MTNPISLYIGDDHPVIIEGIKNLIARRPDISVVGSSHDPRIAVEDITRLKPDVALLDLYFGDALGSEIVRRIRGRSLQCKILIYTVLPESGFTLELLKLGANGYLNKNSPIDEIVKAIQIVHRGGTYLSENFRIEYEANTGVAGQSPFESLSRQEYSVMLMLIKGARNKEIQEELDLRQQTVTTYTSRIFRMLGVRNVPELIRAAQLNGLQI